MDCEIPHQLGGERSILYKGVEISPWQTRFKNFEGKPKRESPKRIISASGGLGPLQMVSEPDTGQCASKGTEPRREVDTEQCASADVGPRRGVECEISHRLERGTSASDDIGPQMGWIVRSHIGWGGEQIILFKGVETSP